MAYNVDTFDNLVPKNYLTTQPIQSMPSTIDYTKPYQGGLPVQWQVKSPTVNISDPLTAQTVKSVDTSVTPVPNTVSNLPTSTNSGLPDISQYGTINSSWFGRDSFNLNEYGNKVIGDLSHNYGLNSGLLTNGVVNGTISPYELQTLDQMAKTGKLTKEAVADLNATWAKEHSEYIKSQPTGLQWAGLGLQVANGLFGAYMGHKNYKLQKANLEEQKALNRANFKMQAKAYNNSLRNQQSGRGYIGMSGSAMRTLGREYDRRKAEKTY